MIGGSPAPAMDAPLPGESLYAAPREVASAEDCLWYHTMEVPGLGLVEGQWDLRAGVEEYLGRVKLAGKRVLEVGTASGFLCFEMERRGAEVVAYDLSEKDDWDVVPYAGLEAEAYARKRREHLRRLNNSFWLAHRRLGSAARLVHGTAYSVPAGIGEVDIATFGSVLLHLRDPFLALQSALRLTRETAVVTDLLPRFRGPARLLARLAGGREAMTFLPDFRAGAPRESWWRLSPGLVTEFLGVLGFAGARVTFHRQSYRGRRLRLYTVVAIRPGRG